MCITNDEREVLGCYSPSFKPQCIIHLGEELVNLFHNLRIGSAFAAELNTDIELQTRPSGCPVITGI